MLLDKILIGAGMALVGLGVGFLAAAPLMLEIRESLILGGLLWSVLGGVTAIIGRSVGAKKMKQLGALR
ncbi:MAG: hypothetical protein EB170_08005 [Nitrosopumilaceae archaeon]|nr:hypothetical protein [Nitrosopumilaceae archaeon]NDF25784.1 hypothetical protein [Nitrososphaerota archaeon]